MLDDAVCLRSFFLKRSQPTRNYVMKERNATGNPDIVVGLLILGEPVNADKRRETLHVLWEKHRIMEQQFVAFVAEDLRVFFLAPWALRKYSLGQLSFPVGRTPKEPFCHEVVSGRMASALLGWLGVFSRTV